MIFLDTSALYALADQSDPYHKSALKSFESALDAQEPLLTHNYVLLESMALIQHRIGLAAAVRLAEESRAFEIEWVDKPIHDEAVRHLARSRKRQVSLVDQVSFIIMRRRGVELALAFDPDFVEEGFSLYGVEDG